MRPIVYRFRAATRTGRYLRRCEPFLSRASVGAWLIALIITAIASGHSAAETRPHYGGTLRVMMQSSPATLTPSTSGVPSDYWDEARALSLIGDTLVTLDARGHAKPSLAVAWQGDASARHWQFTLREGVKFQDGSWASSAMIAQILGALHPNWTVRAATDVISIDTDQPAPSLLAELALPRNLLLKHKDGDTGIPLGTGPFLVSAWQPGKLLKLTANEDSWAGRPFVDAIEIEFGKSPRDQAVALELDKADVIGTALQSGLTQQSHSASSLPVELLALVFPATSRAQDLRVREALALAINRKPIQAVLLKGSGEFAAGILPNWMTGYDALFNAQADPERARAVLADAKLPILTLSYDPRDPQAQLIAERIALNAREVGITVQVSLSGAADIRLVRAVLPSSDPATSLAEVARQLGLSQPVFPVTVGKPSLDDLYQAERSLLHAYSVIPLFHLPVTSAASARICGWQPDLMGGWSAGGSSVADSWMCGSRATDARLEAPSP